MNPDNSKPTNFFKFENLRIYYKAIDFADAILVLATNYQGNNQATNYFFTKFIDEAFCIAASITDGSAGSKTQFVNELQNTKKAIRNCLIYNTIALKRELIDETQGADIRNELMELTKMVGALIVSLQKQDSTTEGSDW